jgi:hypothetical protein
MNNEKKAASVSLLNWHGATLQLLFLLILPVVALLLAVTFGSLWLHQQAMRNMVAERDERAARGAAAAPPPPPPPPRPPSQSNSTTAPPRYGA